MKLTLNRLALLNAVSAVAANIPSMTDLPVVTCVRLIAKPYGRTRLIATDLDVFSETRVESETIEAGDVCIPGKLFQSLLKKITAEDLTLEQEADQRLKLTAGETTVELPVLDGSDFPPGFELATCHSIDVSPAELRQALTCTAFAMSADETRYVLNGVNLELTGRSLQVTATDGRRLSTIPIRTRANWLPRGEDGQEKPLSVTLPSGCVGLVKTALGTASEEEQGEVTIDFGGDLDTGITHVRFTFDGGRILVSKVIEGNYPNFRVVIPEEASREVHFNVLPTDLIPALERAIVLAGDKEAYVELAVAGPHLTVTLTTATSARLVDAIVLPGTPDLELELKVKFDAAYLLDAAKVAADNTLLFSFTDKEGSCPGVLTDSSRWIHILMPLRPEAKAEDEPSEAEAGAPNSDSASSSEEPTAETQAA